MAEHLIRQAIFRELLAVMSRPGTVRTLPRDSARISPHGLVAIAATLLDQEVTYAVVDDDDLHIAVLQKTDARPAPVPEADFIFIASGGSGGRIAEAQRGTHAYPDAGATVLYQVEQLAEESSAPSVELSGPGIAAKARPLIGGLDGGDLELLSSINQEYPLGIDVICVDRRLQVMALPRSTQLTATDT